MKKTFKKHFASLMSVLLIAVMAFSLVGCGTKKSDLDRLSDAFTNVMEGAANELADSLQVTVTPSVATDEDSPSVTEVGEGSTHFMFEVVDAEGNTTYFNVATDKTTVGEALTDCDLIDGDESEYGLYVKVVNGITADYDVDQTYWAFYIDGEYAATGVDSTEVVDGSTYSFKVEK